MDGTLAAEVDTTSVCAWASRGACSAAHFSVNSQGPTESTAPRGGCNRAVDARATIAGIRPQGRYWRRRRVELEGEVGYQPVAMGLEIREELIGCHDCGGRVSFSAASCPHCGSREPSGPYIHRPLEQHRHRIEERNDQTLVSMTILCIGIGFLFGAVTRAIWPPSAMAWSAPSSARQPH